MCAAGELLRCQARNFAVLLIRLASSVLLLFEYAFNYMAFAHFICSIRAHSTHP